MLVRWNLLCVLATFVLLSSCEERTNPWPAMAKADINFIKKIVEQNHPGYVDPANPQFKTQLEKNYSHVINQLQYVNSLDAVLNLDNEFIASFADYHVSIALRFTTNYPVWAGIKLERLHDKYVVTKLMDNWPTEQPLLGSELISCNGRTANEIMNYDILRYRYANYDAEYPRLKFASKLLIDDGVGFRKRAEKCNFRDEVNKDTTITLQWLPLENHSTAEWDSSIIKPDSFSLEKLNESVTWVRVPTFSPSSTDKITLNDLFTSLATLPTNSDSTIVFDLRGNGGGLLGTPEKLLQSVYGTPVFLTLFSTEIKNSNAHLRASRNHIEHLQQFAINDALSTEQLAYNSALISEMENALTKNIPFVDAPKHPLDLRDADKRSVEDIQQSLPRLVVLTDHFCASACLIFVSLVLHEPKNIHIGTTTYADSPYSFIYSQFPFELPSKLGSINLPLAIFGANGPFIPSIGFSGDINNSHDIKQWFLMQKLNESKVSQ